MRSDMAKIIVERPRMNRVHGYHEIRAVRKNDVSDEAPCFEGMRWPHIIPHDKHSEILISAC